MSVQNSLLGTLAHAAILPDGADFFALIDEMIPDMQSSVKIRPKLFFLFLGV